MGATTTANAAAPETDGDSESATLLLSQPSPKIPKDSFHVAYIIYFTLGVGYLLPWNAFITAVDYFTYLYPDMLVDRVFGVVNMGFGVTSLIVIVAFANKWNSVVRINVGYAFVLVALTSVPLIDIWYVKGRVGVDGGFYATICMLALCGVADGLVQGGVVGKAGELPERYMQAVVSGTAASGVLVSVLRILTKASFPQDFNGLRRSANLYFIVSITVMFLNVIFYNMAHRLPIIEYYNNLKSQEVDEEKERKGDLTGKVWRSTLWDIVGSVKWYGYGITIIYVVTLCIFPGSITEDVHSNVLKSWYPLILIACYNIFDLIGKSLTSLYLLENTKVTVWASFGRLLFLPIFYACLHGPDFLRTEIPVTILTCLLGLTNGYLTSVLMILAPKNVPLQHSEIAGIVLVLYLEVGLAIGSVISWAWVL